MGAAKSRNPIHVGNQVLIRTTTVYDLGRIVEITPMEIVLSDASWVADTGRFSDCLARGTLSVVEVFAHEVAVARSSIVDVTLWPHELPTTSK